VDDPAPTRTVGWILVVLQVELSLPVRRSEAVPGLRASDAAHMDERRAPRLLTTIMRPSGTSDEHWNLNGKLARPQADGDAIVYSSGPEFLVDDADPRWRCFDAAQVSDTELREVDILLENLTSPRFAMRRVRGVESPRNFAQYVRTEGRNRVDARLRISNLPKLVRLLGKHSDFNDLQYCEAVSPVPATTRIPTAFANIR
jgi:hypothetical protein